MEKYLFLLAFLTACAFGSEQDCIDNSSTIQAKLSCIPRLTFKELTDPPAPENTIQFEIQFKQPVDHQDPSKGAFYQKLILSHANTLEPMVLHTSGYSIFGIRKSVLTNLFGTNQIQVEHRYFSESKPEMLDWTKLNIKQSADDFHEITKSLKQIYSKPWINTGASKGGMTSVYHRRFYPDDLAGTVADVAPLSFSKTDLRYVDFVDKVGGDTYKECRENFKLFQIDTLKKRDEIVPTITGTFGQLGSADVAFEHAVIESAFYFWQYGNPDSQEEGCKAIPVNGTTIQLTAFLKKHAPLDSYTDKEINQFKPYYYQAATELGNPENLTGHLDYLRKHPFTIDQYTPKGETYTYSNAPMVSVDQWVRKEADKILFVYGEFDPWSAGAFPETESGKDIKKLTVAKGNHGAKISYLSETDKALAISILSLWFGKSPVKTFTKMDSSQSLEELEFQMRKKLKIR